MGRHSHKSAPFMCGACKKGFGSEQAARDHAKDAHPKAIGVGIYRCIDRIDGPEHEPSFGERAVAAELALAMGEHTDDEWLLGL